MENDQSAIVVCEHLNSNNYSKCFFLLFMCGLAIFIVAYEKAKKQNMFKQFEKLMERFEEKNQIS